MANLKIQRDWLEEAKQRGNLSEQEKVQVEKILGDAAAKGSISADVSAFPPAFLHALLDDARLTPNQRAVVSMEIHGMSHSRVDRDKVYNAIVETPVQFGSMYFNLGTKSPNAEMFWNGRWYPVIMHVQFLKNDKHLSKTVLLYAQLSICEITYCVTHVIHPEYFLDETGHRRERTIVDVLNQIGLRKLQTTPADFNLKLLRAERLSREMGQVVMVSGPVLKPASYVWWSKMESQALGTAEFPRKAVVEPELEVNENQRSYYAPQGGETPSRLPFVRIFSLETKTYVYADVEDVKPYEFDATALGRLQLPPEMLSILSRVFNTPVEQMFGDLIQGKHGGLVILACGRPGVGKTLTAEVYAETTERPLYVLELGELGTNVAQVEENLQRVFTRVARWNAVLQFDECEIFLTERGEDLERSAIVGIFLRLLDYYRGILFLTTNRPEVLDHAVLSRVMLKMHYPDLTRGARAAIWQTMFTAAGLTLQDGSFDELAESDMNGRQIRNLARLAKILHPGNVITLDQMRQVLKYGCGIQEPGTL
jgi:hypothetical protein